MRVFSWSSWRCILLGGVAAGAAACQSEATTAGQLRLKFIDDTLLAGNEELWRDNDRRVKEIQAQVEKNRQPPAGLRVLRQAEDLRDSTRTLVDYLHVLRERLLRQTGNQPRFQQLDGQREVADLLGQSGAATDTLQLRLRTYTRYLHRIAPDSASRPAAPPLVGDFTDATVAGALATLAQQETQLLLREAATLTALRARVEVSPLRMNYRALASAEDNEVVPGTTYRANLLLATALYDARRMRMTANGQPVAPDADGFAQVHFPVPMLNGAVRRQASWLGAITVKTTYGRDSTFRVRVPYTIVRRR